MTKITLRTAEESDYPFITSLSPILAQEARFGWHKAETIQKFQDEYIEEMLDEAEEPHITLIADRVGIPLGFVHARETSDELSGEKRCTVPLLAVKEDAQGSGAGKALMKAVEVWAQKQGYRLVHLEVFSTNKQAQGFYRGAGYQEETIHMIKALD
ncbi:GNAT family N-acetyltransferase [Kordiimonas laminariae]|uniref:GNAT family N-acetyltransferase n=1 Tax=Kordiimonas laminariae TaxID=2917717 RepID=UPI001FF54D13|nr:N-acetyltransferase [Kordiimonas laminariae]MCK0071148.1 GNAT family N-acetyltransferase [Kordiimonas laminariae]